MRRLLLLRHAKSSWSDEHLPDHDRPLSGRGIRDARRMAKLLAKSQPSIDLVLCSSATRARQTYAHFEDRLEPAPRLRVEPALYLPSLEGLIALLRETPDEVKTLMIVGHSPSLDALALWLSGETEAGLRATIAAKFPTGALCTLELSARPFTEIQRGCASLRALVVPRDLDPSDGAEPVPFKASPIALSAKASALEAARTVIDSCTEQVRANAEGARLGQDPEFVHQMRVGVRRLRVAMAFFRGVLGRDEELDKLADELRWLFRELGPVREYDVFLHDVIEPLQRKHPGRAISSLHSALVTERAALLEDARRSIDSARYTEVIRSLLAYSITLGTRDDDSPSLESWAKRRLRKRLRRVLALDAAVGARDQAALHELRKQLKKLRYGSEFARSAFPPRRAKQYLAKLSALQDVLGELTDVAVGERLLKRALGSVRAGRARTDLADQVRSLFDAHSVHAGLALERVYEDATTAKPFWRD